MMISEKKARQWRSILLIWRKCTKETVFFSGTELQDTPPPKEEEGEREARELKLKQT